MNVRRITSILSILIHCSDANIGDVNALLAHYSPVAFNDFAYCIIGQLWTKRLVVGRIGLHGIGSTTADDYCVLFECFYFSLFNALLRLVTIGYGNEKNCFCLSFPCLMGHGAEGIDCW